MGFRLILLASLAFACGYGIKQKICGFNRNYFNVVLCGLGALFLSRLYYVILVLSDGDDGILTVGVLGQAAAYLFFITADRSFLSREVLEKSKKKLCIPGFIGAAILTAMFMIAAVKAGTASAYIAELIYVFSISVSFYVAANAVSYRNVNTACRATCRFNLCVCILAALNAMNELSCAFELGTFNNLILWILAGICAVIIVIMMPLLSRGMKIWPQ